MYKLGLENAEDQRSNYKHLLDHRESKGIPEKKKIYFCFIDYTIASDCVDHKVWKILKDMGIPDHLTCLLRNLYAGQEAIIRIGHGTTGSKLGKEYVKAVYCHQLIELICRIYHLKCWAG